MDPDAINYDPEAEKADDCNFYLANGVALYSLPVNKANGQPWDSTSAPDLYAKLYLEDGSGPTYQSELVPDYLSQYLPTDDFKLANKTWKIELWDKDEQGMDELMFSGSFNPKENGKDDRIPFNSNGVDIKLQYFKYMEDQ